MRKIAALYRNYVEERNEEIKEYQTGGKLMEELRNFLKQKLSAEDYFTAEEMLNAIVAQTEEKGFTEGCKYIADLGNELFTNK
jgi:DNA topoisomerase IA